MLLGAGALPDTGPVTAAPLLGRSGCWSQATGSEGIISHLWQTTENIIKAANKIQIVK